MPNDSLRPPARGPDAEPVAKFLRSAHDGRTPILFLDYDGTLAPFTVDRDSAVPYPGVTEWLERLATETSTRIILVSGRAPAVVRRLLGSDLALEIWGSHGLERMKPGGRVESVPLDTTAREAIERARDVLEPLNLGDGLELKPAAVAVHVRGLPEKRAAERLHRVEDLWATILDTTSLVEVHRFDGGIELRSSTVNKGHAVGKVVEEMSPDAPVAFLGDDLTDEDAFAALAGRGLRVLVRPEPRQSQADVWLVPPEELFEFFEAWRARFATPPTQSTHSEMTSKQDVTIVSNRLPIVLRPSDNGGWSIGRGSGGLVQAMNPILERFGGNWFGWPGVVAEDVGDQGLPLDKLEVPYVLHPVVLDREEVDDYYRGFANSIVWPLFHNFPDRCTFDPPFWEAYLRVNEKFADSIADQLPDGHDLWIHDYHLMHLADMLRERMKPGRVGFFLHIPFPSLDNFVKIPWRADMLRALLAYDLIGFQSARDRRHFLDCVQRLMPEVPVEVEDGLARIRLEDRIVSVGAFPIGLDFDSWSSRAASDEVEQRVRLLRREIGPYQVLLGIDRLDYTKGLLERFLAFEHALEKHPTLIEKAMLFQLVVPSREKVPEYAALKREIDRTVGRINGRFSTPSWEPIRYLYNTVDPVELTALYRLADVAVVTPLCDGMNLVCKEYIASQVDEHGVLVLGEMAGAASQLSEWALLVNPYDIEGTADTIARAVTMRQPQRCERMQALRHIVAETNVFRWAESFISAMRTPETLDQQSAPEYLPHIDAPSRR